MTTDALPFLVEREVALPAPPEVVWTYLAQPAGWAAWWGEGSSIDARPGGALGIVYPDGRMAEGEVLEADPPRRIRFTWGFDRPDAIVPVGGSIVTIVLTPTAEGTRLALSHELADGAARDHHVPGWRYQLGLFRSLVARDALGPVAAGLVDRWHQVWGVADGAERRALLGELVTADVVVAEPAAATVGIDDLDGFIQQSRQHLPGTVRRDGPPALNGATLTWAWTIEVRGVEVHGRSVGELTADHRFARLTSFWLQAPPGVPVSTLDA